MKYEVYTDGSCLGNPGRGGTGAVVYLDGVVDHTFSQGYEKTTNNRMELLAVIKVLEKFNDKENVEIWTDSEYVQKGITMWINNWKKNNWISSSKKPVKNKDLWELLDELNKPNVKYHWIKGHSNEEGNETADSLARCAAERGPFIVDPGYK